MPHRQLSGTRRTVLRGAAVAAGLTGTASLPALAHPRSFGAVRKPDDRPNVIVISVDDLGWQSLGCYGNTFNETPNLDRLARRGMRFTQAYAAAPVCSPSRAALITGRYPSRVGVTDYLRNNEAASEKFLRPDAGTAARLLSRRGYTSGLIGKWHLTESYSGPYRERPGNPYAHGFDEVVASEQTYIAAGDYTYPYFFMPDLPARSGDEYLTDRLTDETVDYLGRHRDEPFFLHLSNYAVHATLVGKEDLVAKYSIKTGAGLPGNDPVYAAMVESIDDQVGRVVETLHTLGIAENTLLFVVSDNGAPFASMNRPLRGIKGSLNEGGIRIPMIAYWPGHIEGGQVSDALVSLVDVLPTAWDLATGDKDVEPAGPGFDGISLVGTLTGGARADGRRLFWDYPHFMDNRRPSAAIREGRFKLIRYLRHHHLELYDVIDDPGERKNLARSHPGIAIELDAKLTAHLADVDLLPPSPARYPVSLSGSHPMNGPLGDDELLILAGATSAVARHGRLEFSATTDSDVLVTTRAAPIGAEFALVVDTVPEGASDEDGDEAGDRDEDRDSDRSDDQDQNQDRNRDRRRRRRRAKRRQDRPVRIGLVKDAQNQLMVRYHPRQRSVDWQLLRDGMRQREGLEILDRLVGSVDLSAPGSRLGLSLRDTTVAVYVDPGGTGWQFLFRFDVGRVIDLRRAADRKVWRYAVGADLRPGLSEVTGFDAKVTRRTARKWSQRRSA